MLMKAGIAGIARPERARHDGADVRRRNRLRRRVSRVPLVLMPGMQDEAEVAGGVAADDRAAIDDATDALEALRELDVVDGRVDGGKRAQAPGRARAPAYTA